MGGREWRKERRYKDVRSIELHKKERMEEREGKGGGRKRAREGRREREGGREKE